MDWGGLHGWIAVGAGCVVFGTMLAFGWRLHRRVKRHGPEGHRFFALVLLNVGVLGVIGCIAMGVVLGFEWRKRATDPRRLTPEQRVKLLQDGDRQVRLNAVSWLRRGQAPPEIAVPALIAALDDRSGHVRRTVMRCLATHRADAADAAPRLAKFLEADPRSDDAAQAYYALRMVGGAAATAVEPLLHHPDAAVRDAAVAVLVKVDPPPLDIYRRLLDEGHGATLRSVLRTCVGLKGGGGRMAEPLVLQLTARDDPREQWMIAWALFRIDPDWLEAYPDAAPAVAAGLDAAAAATLKQRPKWRERACELLGQLPQHADRGVPALRAALADEVTARAAVKALAKFGAASRPALPELIAALAQTRTRAPAIEALRAIGPDAAAAVRTAMAALPAAEKHQLPVYEHALKQIAGD